MHQHDKMYHILWSKVLPVPFATVIGCHLQLYAIKPPFRRAAQSLHLSCSKRRESERSRWLDPTSVFMIIVYWNNDHMCNKSSSNHYRTISSTQLTGVNIHCTLITLQFLLIKIPAISSNCPSQTNTLPSQISQPYKAKIPPIVKLVAKLKKRAM